MILAPRSPHNTPYTIHHATQILLRDDDWDNEHISRQVPFMPPNSAILGSIALAPSNYLPTNTLAADDRNSRNNDNSASAANTTEESAR